MDTNENDAELEKLTRLTLDVALGEPVKLDENLRLVDLRQANLLIHELCAMLAVYAKHPLAELMYGDTLPRASDVLSSVAHYVACPRRGEENDSAEAAETTTEGDETQWKPRLPLLD